MSGVGGITEETRHACGIAEAAIAEAAPVHGQVENRVALLTAQAEASTVHVVDALSKRAIGVVAH